MIPWMLPCHSSFLSKFNHPFKMTSKTLRKTFVFILIFVCVGLFYKLTFVELFYKLTIRICTSCQTNNESTLFERPGGHFLLLPRINCSRNYPFLVILVTSSSADGQSDTRMAIRNTWGKENLIASKHIVTFFLLGISLNHNNQIAVTAESQKYKDIIQKDFIDTYYNLTLKTMMGIEWVHKFCPQSSFVMKTDSDMFVNPYYLTELLLKKNRTTRLFTGFLKLNEHPIREIWSKWYVSYYEFPGNNYPPFCSGTGYVLSTDVANQVYNVSKKIPFIKLEDVFIGLCLAELNIIPEELHSKQTFFPEGVTFSVCHFKKIVTSHFVKPRDLLVYWNALETSMDEVCSGD